jgi:hypothetical protein
MKIVSVRDSFVKLRSIVLLIAISILITGRTVTDL